MIAEAGLQEYLDEIRQEVCSRCVERPEGGPPCTPLGKVCGVELHLPELVNAVKDVHSGLMAPYLESTREKVCQHCPFLHEDCCPCPMDSLAVLVVQAIETVDERHSRRQPGLSLIEGLPPAGAPALAQIAHVYREAVGTWTGCDWPTSFGSAGLDLNEITATEAEALAVEMDGSPEGPIWASAARWLEEVERRAKRAEREAALAMEAANAGAWEDATVHARKAWGLEFQTGRPLRHAHPTWLRLCEVISEARRQHGSAEG